MALNVTQHQAGWQEQRRKLISLPWPALCGFHPCSPPTSSGIINTLLDWGALSSWKTSHSPSHTGLYTKSLSQGNAAQDTSPEHLFPHQSPEPRVALTLPQHATPTLPPWPQNQAVLLMPFQSSPILACSGYVLNNLSPSKGSCTRRATFRPSGEYLHFGKR